MSRLTCPNMQDDRSAKSGPRFGNVSSPSKPAGYGANPHFGNGSGGYESGGAPGAVDEITASLRGMVVGDDYSNSQQSPYRQGIATMPQPQTAPPQANNRPPFQHHQSRPSFNTYTPQADYTAYYTGQTGTEYSYGYDSYRGNPDAMVYSSPAQTAGGVSAPSIYAGVTATPVHPHVQTDVHGQSTGMFYNFPGSPRPAGSQFYYSAPQPMVFHSSAPPHSPMQPTAISTMPPASLSDKKREMQVCNYALLNTKKFSCCHFYHSRYDDNSMPSNSSNSSTRCMRQDGILRRPPMRLSMGR